MKLNYFYKLIVFLMVLALFFLLYAMKVESEKRNEIDSRLKGKTIVIDPGHGGIDVGSIGTTLGTKEKDINLRVAINIKNELENRTDAKVVLTRANDKDLGMNQKESLRKRVEITKERNADLFISIHHDAFTDTNVAGITTHYFNQKDKRLAKLVQEEIYNAYAQVNNRGIKKSDYYVLKNNNAPSVLIELGFTSNSGDEKRMNSTDFQIKTAEAIVNGVIEYFSTK